MVQEVIFFHGPPFCGKSVYFDQNLKSSYDRISAEEIYRQHPDWGLRNVVLQIVRLLEEGKNVVVDDENWSRKTRISYKQSIQAKVPFCKFACYIFKPSDAFVCLWRREWFLARQFAKLAEDAAFAVDVASTEARIRSWFERASGNPVQGLDDIAECERWDHTKDIRTTLTAFRNYKFEVPCLLIEWIALKDKCYDEFQRGLKIWNDNATCGRIIVLASTETEDTETVEDDSSHKSLLHDVKSGTEQMGKELDTPVYFLIIRDQKPSGAFTKPHESGILSFLQFIHCLDLNHPRTVYIHQSSTKKKPHFPQTGVKQIHISAVCNNPFVLRTSKTVRTLTPSHPALSDIQYVEECSDINPMVPLYDLVSREADRADGSFVTAERWGRVLGVSFCDKKIFERYNDMYISRATHISCEGDMSINVAQDVQTDNERDKKSTMTDQGTGQVPTKRSKHGSNLPIWLQGKRKNDRPDADADVENSEGVSPGCQKKDKRAIIQESPRPIWPKTIYCMTVAELRDVAKLFLEETALSDGENLDVTSSNKLDVPNVDETESSSVLKDDVQAVARSRDSMNKRANILCDKRTDFPSDSLSEERVKLLEEDNPSRVEGDYASRVDISLRTNLLTRGNSEQMQAVKMETDVSGKMRKDGDNSGTVTEEDGVAGIITDLFLDSGKPRRPPPKKKTFKSTENSSNMLWPLEDSFPMNQSVADPHKHSDGSKQTQRQDMSFLDEIF